MRAARLLWAKIVKQFNPKIQVFSVAYTVKLRLVINGTRSFNNVGHATLKQWRLLWGTQSLHTNAFG